jgi:hypothetical protein
VDQTTTYDTLHLIFGFFVILLGILWVLIPFAVFGIKGLLRDLLREVRRNNELQDQIVSETRLMGRTRVVETRELP